MIHYAGKEPDWSDLAEIILVQKIRRKKLGIEIQPLKLNSF